MKGSGRTLTELLSRNLAGATEGNHDKLGIAMSDRDSNKAPHKYESRALQPPQPARHYDLSVVQMLEEGCGSGSELSCEVW
jgi:hypothetical protein